MQGFRALVPARCETQRTRKHRLSEQHLRWYRGSSRNPGWPFALKFPVSLAYPAGCHRTATRVHDYREMVSRTVRLLRQRNLRPRLHKEGGGHSGLGEERLRAPRQECRRRLRHWARCQDANRSTSVVPLIPQLDREHANFPQHRFGVSYRVAPTKLRFPVVRRAWAETGTFVAICPRLLRTLRACGSGQSFLVRVVRSLRSQAPSISMHCVRSLSFPDHLGCNPPN